MPVVSWRHDVCIKEHIVISVPVYTRHGARGVAQLVEALRYKPEGRDFDSASNK